MDTTLIHVYAKFRDRSTLRKRHREIPSMFKIMKKITWRLIPVICLLIGTGCTPYAEKQSSDGDKNVRRLTLFAAAGTTNAVGEIIELFEKQENCRVVVNFASSSTLAQQIEMGTDADLFISANSKWADYLQEKEMVAKRENVVCNSLVVIVPKTTESIGEPAGIDSLIELLDRRYVHLALGDTDHVPVGIYAKEALVTAGIWDAIQPKVVPAKDTRAALSYVETGAAEAGIVYATDAAISDDVEVVYEIPAEHTQPIVFPGMILQDAEDIELTERFFDFLTGNEAAAVFEKYGFHMYSDEGDTP